MSYSQGRIITDDDVDLEWKKWDQDEEMVKVKPAASFMDDVIESFFDNSALKGVRWPWSRWNEHELRIRPAELTVYAGHSGSFKSFIQSQVAAHLMNIGERCLISSFEMRPVKTLARMVRQCGGTDQPSMRYMKGFKGWSTGKLWLYDHLGNVEPRKVLAVMRYAHEEFGVQHFFVDSLMKVMAKTDDYSEQKKFVGDLMNFAQARNVHAHLVAHTRKPQAGGKMSKHDVHGAGEIEKQADNVILIQRNEDKKNDDAAKKEAGQMSVFDPVAESEPDLWIKWDKQREGEFEGVIPMFFNPKSFCVRSTVEHDWHNIDVEDGRGPDQEQGPAV